MAAEADSTAVVEVDSTGAEVVFAAASAAADIPVSAGAGGRLEARIAARADSGREASAGPRIEVRWAPDRFQVRNRARALVQAWPGGVSAVWGDHREFAMPLRMANGTLLETPAA